MNQSELKAEALRHIDMANNAFSLDEQANVIAAAQVFATLATIPDEPELLELKFGE